MRAHQLIRWAAKTVDASEAEILLSHFIKQPRAFLLTHPEAKISFFQSVNFWRAVKKRRANWPIAYLIGHKAFFGRDFIVSPDTLIPRPDSECIVESVIEQVEHSTPLIIDIGTGSGALAITLAAEIPTAQVFASDVSRAALKIARKNGLKNQVRVNFVRGSLLTPHTKIIRHSAEPVFIIANLPYLKPDEVTSEPSLTHEPILALVGGPDGLELYRELWTQIYKLRAEKKHTTVWHVWCEINPEQSEALNSLIISLFPLARFIPVTDLSGRTRAMHITLN